MGYLSQAFAIAAFALSIIAIFVPYFGVFMAGLSGILAWGSYGRLIALGFTASIINIINIVLLSPTSLILIALESSQRTPDQSMTLKIWIIVLAIQIIALVLLISNLIVFRILKGKKRIRDCEPKHTTSDFKQSENYDTGISDHRTKQSLETYIPQPPGSTKEAKSGIIGVLPSKTQQNQKIKEKAEPDGVESHTAIIDLDKRSRSNKGQFSPIPVFGTVFLLGVIIWGVFNLVLYDKPYVPLSRVYEDIQGLKSTSSDIQKPDVLIQESVTNKMDKEPPGIIPPDEKKLLPNTTITQEMLDEAWGDLKPDTKKPELSSPPFEPQKPLRPKVVSRAKPAKPEDKLYYYYAIKFKTGERIVTKNAIIHEDAVDYIDRNGNMTSVNRNLIESLKRYYYKQKN